MPASASTTSRTCPDAHSEFSRTDRDDAHAVPQSFRNAHLEPCARLRDSIAAQRFTPATPSPEERRAFAGRYASPELGVTGKISFDKDHLALDNARSDLMDIAGQLEPAMTDAFTAGGGTFRFTRGTDGHVSGMQLSASRMQGILVDRLNP